MNQHQATPRSGPPVGATDRERMAEFLLARLTEDLAAVWARGQAGGAEARPGMVDQVAVLDEILTTVRSGQYPSRRELRILLFGYGDHPDYDPAWTDLLLDAPDL